VVDRFVVRPAQAGGWDYIGAALARLFERLRATGWSHCVIVDLGDHYVQFIVRPDGGLWAEAVGDVFLPGYRYSDEQRRTLESLGWRSSELFGHGRGNYCREYPERGHDLEAATIAVLTCVDVFGAGPRTEVRVEVFEAVGARG
jgi:hypothetical protein